MTQSEELVGRRLPRPPSHLDTLMAGFARGPEGHGAMEPADPWMRPAHRRARREGWIRYGFGLAFERGRPVGIWYPTEKGMIEAKAALARVEAANEARDRWSRECVVAWKERAR